MVGEVPQQVMVEELGAIVTIEVSEFKGEAGLDVFDLCYNTCGAVVPCGPALGPAGVDIGESQAPDEVTSQRVTAVSDGIGLHEAGLRDVPVCGYEWESDCAAGCPVWWHRDLWGESWRGLGPAVGQQWRR